MDAVERYRKRRDTRMAQRRDAEWNEEDHPRGENGQFTSGGGNSGGSDWKVTGGNGKAEIKKKSVGEPKKTTGERIHIKLPNSKRARHFGPEIPGFSPNNPNAPWNKKEEENIIYKPKPEKDERGNRKLQTSKEFKIEDPRLDPRNAPLKGKKEETGRWVTTQKGHHIHT